MIVLDTNLLHGRANPDAAGPVKTILALAAEVGVEVALPEPCLLELRQGIREKLEDSTKKLNDVVSKLALFHAEITAPQVDVEAALSRYEELLQGFLRRHNITLLPFPERMPGPSSLFELAVRKAPPFDSSGNSYRDAMIALIVEDCRRRSESVVFVTDDGGFRGTFSASGVSAMNVKDATAFLEKRLSTAQQRRREIIRDAVSSALSHRLPEISTRAAAELRFAIESPGFGSALHSIDAFTATKVAAVDPGEMDGPTVEFTAKVEGALSYTVQTDPAAAATYSRAMARALRSPGKVGDTAIPEDAPAQAWSALSLANVGRVLGYDDARIVERQVATVTLLVEGAAVLDGDRVIDVKLGTIRQERDHLFRMGRV